MGSHDCLAGVCCFKQTRGPFKTRLEPVYMCCCWYIQLLKAVIRKDYDKIVIKPGWNEKDTWVKEMTESSRSRFVWFMSPPCTGLVLGFGECGMTVTFPPRDSLSFYEWRNVFLSYLFLRIGVLDMNIHNVGTCILEDWIFLHNSGGGEIAHRL